MATDIQLLEKKIYQNKPVENSYAQYNKGVIQDGDAVRIMGKKRSNRVNIESDLYSIIQHKVNTNLVNYPAGILNGIGSQIEILGANVKEDNAESDGGRYTGVKFAFYIYDGNSTTGKAIANATTGDKIKSAIGIGDEFDLTDNRVRYWNKGDQKQDTTVGDIIIEDNATYGGQPTIPSWDDISPATDFPNKNIETVPFNDNIQDWTDYLTNTHNDDESNESYIWIVGRASGDERETIWPFGTKTDERDRTYIKLRIPKSELYDIWKNKKGESITYERVYDATKIRHNNRREDLGKYVRENYRDTYGNLNGHSSLTDSWDPINHFTRLTISIKAPTFSPLNSIKSIENGGMNANWVDSTNGGWHCINIVDSTTGEQVGLNPKYDIDFTGFPSEFYIPAGSTGNKSSISGNYFSSSMIPDFRPISFVSSSFNIDLQGYYDGNTNKDAHLRVQSSIPTEVTLKLKLAKSNTDFSPEYIDLSNDGYYNKFNYHFFVVNWDWQEDDPDTLEQIGEVFPINNEEWSDLVEDGLYDLKDINTGDSITITGDRYIESGIKTIKVVVLSTINNDWESDNSGTKPYSTYVQAVYWKLITIKIYLSNDGAKILSDFTDIGGDDFTFLPYPDVINLNRNTNGGEGPPSDPSNGIYRSSHIVISGLSDESIYIQGLKKIHQTNLFSKSEIDEKNLFQKAKSLSPIGDMNEWGDYLGQSDISQVRFFNKSYDMREMLDITTVYDDGTTFHNYNDIYDEIDNPGGYWNAPESYSFPKESSVGDIFIDEYDYLKESCVVELNCGILDGKTVRDTSGSGNKGILIGDYSINKSKIGKPTTRDSYIKTPKTGNKDGAF